MSVGEWIGTAGVSLLLLAFALNLLGKLNSKSTAYLLLNIIGAALACWSSYIIHFWPLVVLEGVWALSSLFTLATKRKA